MNSSTNCATIRQAAGEVNGLSTIDDYEAASAASRRYIKPQRPNRPDSVGQYTNLATPAQQKHFHTSTSISGQNCHVQIVAFRGPAIRGQLVANYSNPRLITVAYTHQNSSR
jgi:hypothetical protein